MGSKMSSSSGSGSNSNGGANQQRFQTTTLGRQNSTDARTNGYNSGSNGRSRSNHGNGANSNTVNNDQYSRRPPSRNNSGNQLHQDDRYRSNTHQSETRPRNGSSAQQSVYGSVQTGSVYGSAVMNSQTGISMLSVPSSVHGRAISTSRTTPRAGDDPNLQSGTRRRGRSSAADQGDSGSRIRKISSGSRFDDIHNNSSSSSSSRPRNKRSIDSSSLKVDLRHVAKELISGVMIIDRSYTVVLNNGMKYHQSYPECFEGIEAVRYLVDAKLAVDEQQAVDIGRLLLNDGAIEHVNNDYDFENKPYFYRFSKNLNKYLQGQDISLSGSTVGSSVSSPMAVTGTMISPKNKNPADSRPARSPKGRTPSKPRNGKGQLPFGEPSDSPQPQNDYMVL